MTAERYRVYRAGDGVDPLYCGEFHDREEAIAYASSEPGGLPANQWATAAIAGHCAGQHAPEGGEEDNVPIGWYGREGWHCVVRVAYE